MTSAMFICCFADRILNLSIFFNKSKSYFLELFGNILEVVINKKAMSNNKSIFFR